LTFLEALPAVDNFYTRRLLEKSDTSNPCVCRLGVDSGMAAFGPLEREADVPPMASAGRKENGGSGENWAKKLPFVPLMPDRPKRYGGDVRRSMKHSELKNGSLLHRFGATSA
jgi:hypothetical protein